MYFWERLFKKVTEDKMMEFAKVSKRKKVWVAVFFGLLLWGLSSAEAEEGPLKVSIGMSRFSGPQEPMDRVFRIRADFPQTLSVIVTNVSSTSQQFYEHASGGALSSISFEISDDKGNSNVVRKKKDPNASSAVGSTYMQPGEKRVFDIALSEDTWDGAFKLYKKGSRKFKLRAIYENDFKRIYSPYYELIVTSQEDRTQKTSSEEEGSSGVLVSK